jgi:hypothetical protein
MIYVKHRLIATTPPPRMVIVAGSNAMMGIDIQMLVDRFHYPVGNFGFHAGIPIDLSINERLPYIKEGDTILLILEYSYYFGTKGDDQSVARVFEVYPHAILSLLKGNVARYPVLFKILFQTKYIRFREDWVNYDIDKVTNKWGDSLSLLNYPQIELEPKPLVGYQTPNPESIHEITFYLNEFSKKGARRLSYFLRLTRTVLIFVAIVLIITYTST